MTRSDRLIRLQDSNRIFTKDECEAIARRIFAIAGSEGETRVEIETWWQGELRWARNRVSLSADRRDIDITVRRFIHGVEGEAETNQLDDASLAGVVHAAERDAVLFGTPKRAPLVEPPLLQPPTPATAIWSDATYNLSTDTRGQAAQGMIRPAEQKGMIAAGYLEVRGACHMNISSLRPDGPYALWDQPYVRWTQYQCSNTIRDAAGSASGWAGLSGYDWQQCDPSALGARALEKCIASQHPVALEPGRYTVILEPQAVADLVDMIGGDMWRTEAEGGLGPFADAPDNVLKIYRSKLGLKVVDSRITISHDPSDPLLGIIPYPGMRPVTWIDHGILTSLWDDQAYVLSKLTREQDLRALVGYRMSGGTTSMDEMIRTTKRGLLVTRFSNIGSLDSTSLLATGLTRDGLWLIEDGKITKAVKNFRFTESPLFVFNSIEQLGPPVPVFHPVESPYEVRQPLRPAIVPPIKARDFSFTSLIDAI